MSRGSQRTGRLHLSTCGTSSQQLWGFILRKRKMPTLNSCDYLLISIRKTSSAFPLEGCRGASLFLVWCLWTLCRTGRAECLAAGRNLENRRNPVRRDGYKMSFKNKTLSHAALQYQCSRWFLSKACPPGSSSAKEWPGGPGTRAALSSPGSRRPRWRAGRGGTPGLTETQTCDD